MALPPDETRKGLWYALGCYTIWGFFPLYWYPINHSAITADQLLAQRIVWSAVFACTLLLASRQAGALLAAVRQPKVLGIFTLSGVCIGVNWLVYLWAVTHQHVLDASLGYFISPLFNILLGRMVLHETLNRTQQIAIALAAVGVVWLAVLSGSVPWVAVLLALSFGCYGLLRKIAPLAPLPGLVLETLLMLPFAAAYLAYCAYVGQLVFSQLTPLQLGILIGSGVATTVPLVLFAAGAKRIPLSTLGVIQFETPTLQMLLGLLLFGEAFHLNRFVGYVWVWLGIAVYLYGLYQNNRRASALKSSA